MFISAPSSSEPSGLRIWLTKITTSRISTAKSPLISPKIESSGMLAIKSITLLAIRVD